MNLIAVLTALAMGGFCATAQPATPHAPGSLEEPVFGIELSMENIMISFVPLVGHAKRLATVKGDKAYQDLVLSYYEICYWAHDSQVQPWSYQEYRRTMAMEDPSQMFLSPELDWYDWYQVKALGYAEAPQTLAEFDAYRNGTDVAILVNAIEDVKRVAFDILASQYNVTMPDRPLVSIAAPSFMWTVIEPESSEDGHHTNCGSVSDAIQGDWPYVFGLKISNAVQRAGFRREVVNNGDAIMQGREYPSHTSPIAPAGYAAFWNPKFPVGAKASAYLPASSYGAQYEGQPAVVVELTNATLSLWAQQKGPIWSPWKTKPQFGTHQQFEDHPNYMHTPGDPVWSDVVSMIQSLRKFMAYPDSESLNVYLIGDSWQQDMVDAFESYLDNHKYTDLNVEYRGMYAASDGAASITRKMLDASCHS